MPTRHANVPVLSVPRLDCSGLREQVLLLLLRSMLTLEFVVLRPEVSNIWIECNRAIKPVACLLHLIMSHQQRQVKVDAPSEGTDKCRAEWWNTNEQECTEELFVPCGRARRVGPLH